MTALPLTIGTIHFIGIGGIGMSGIAEILFSLGYQVQGSDITENNNVKLTANIEIKANANVDVNGNVDVTTTSSSSPVPLVSATAPTLSSKKSKLKASSSLNTITTDHHAHTQSSNHDQ